MSGKESATNFARGQNIIGKEYADQQLDIIRKMVEKTDNFEGFMLTHSVCGGTGSGYASLLLERLSVDYNKKFKLSNTLYSS